VIDAKLAYAVKILCVTEQACLDPDDPLSDPLCGATVGERPEPLCEIFGLADLNHCKL
jgi:hypothetical protein